jgi:rhodanese-related sulfurtransferase
VKRISHLEIPSDAVLVDIRDELDAMALPLSSLTGLRMIHAPLHDLETGVALELPHGAPLVVVCGTGQRSELAGAYLLADGARDVYLLNGGLRSWRQALERSDLETVDSKV